MMRGAFLTLATAAPVLASGGGHGEPTGGGDLAPALAGFAGAIVLGGAVIVVAMLGRERRRRDREATAVGTEPTDES